MDTAADDAPEHETERGTGRRAGRTGSTSGTERRTIRLLLGVEAAAFLLAAAVHAGSLAGGYEHAAAATAERVIGVVLLAGLATTWLRPRSTATVAAGVQAFALLGTLVGMWTIVVGIGPRTVPDVVYHVLVVVVLAVGLWLAWRSRGAASD